MLDEMLNVRRFTSQNKSNVMGTLNGAYAPTTEESPQVMETTDIRGKSSLNGLDDLDQQILNDYEKVSSFNPDKLKIEVLSSGFKCFDQAKVLRKKRPDLVVLGAPTSHGKSAIMMQIASHVSRQGRVFVHSFEMDNDAYKTRLMSSLTGATIDQVQNGSVLKRHIDLANEEFSSRNLYICKRRDNRVGFVQSHCFKLAKLVGKPDLIVVDYLQKMKSNSPGSIRHLELADILTGLKDLAVQLECPILMGSQLNRSIEYRNAEDEDDENMFRPRMADLKEGAIIGEDADAVVMLVRPEMFNGSRPGEADVFCLKNRGSKTFQSTLRWNGSLCKFSEGVL